MTSVRRCECWLSRTVVSVPRPPATQNMFSHGGRGMEATVLLWFPYFNHDAKSNETGCLKSRTVVSAPRPPATQNMFSHGGRGMEATVLLWFPYFNHDAKSNETGYLKSRTVASVPRPPTAKIDPLTTKINPNLIKNKKYVYP